MNEFSGHALYKVLIKQASSLIPVFISVQRDFSRAMFQVPFQHTRGWDWTVIVLMQSFAWRMEAVIHSKFRRGFVCVQFISWNEQMRVVSMGWWWQSAGNSHLMCSSKLKREFEQKPKEINCTLQCNGVYCQRKLETFYSFLVTEQGCSEIFRWKTLCKTLLIALAKFFAKHPNTIPKQRDSWTRCCILLFFWSRETWQVGASGSLPRQAQLLGLPFDLNPCCQLYQCSELFMRDQSKGSWRK